MGGRLHGPVELVVFDEREGEGAKSGTMREGYGDFLSFRR